MYCVQHLTVVWWLRCCSTTGMAVRKGCWIGPGGSWPSLKLQKGRWQQAQTRRYELYVYGGWVVQHLKGVWWLW